MAFRKFARATVVHPNIDVQGWTGLQNPQIKTAAKVVLQEYDPKAFMLTHCTIIASVDTEKSDEPLGKQMVDGVEIDRRYADWLVTPETNQYVNNNFDCWERKLLLACFRTFVGGENYVEHIQIPELSKGKIIDAAARDIGGSIYVDILVATDRKHKPLISAITSGQLQTLSMGCFLPGTPVTMADGTRLPIEEVRPGAMVLTHKGRAREVLNQQIRGGRWQMRRIKVKGVPDAVEATGTHPFFVLRPASVCGCGCGEALSTKDADPVRRMTKRFKGGHDKRVLNPNGSYSLDEYKARQEQLTEIQSLKVEKVRADELRVGDYVVFPKLDSDVIGDPGSAKARLLGYFLAEGSFTKKKGRYQGVVFSFSLDEKTTFADEVIRLLSEEFPGCRPYTEDRPQTNNCEVRVAGKDIAAWFKQHGGEYSHRKRLSPEVMQWSVESQKHLLGAWLNGDGHNHRGGHAVGTTTSYDLACQFHTLAVRCGIPVWMDCVFGGKCVTVSEAVANGQALRHDETGKLAAFNIYFPQSSASVLAPVTAKAPVEGTRKKTSHFRALEDMVVFPITSIEPFVYEGFVHDIEVEEDHSYQIFNLAVKNCQVEFTTCTKCGNVAYDETQLCNHIRYFKGNEFVDALGKKRRIAELCGHIQEEPGSVKFIEASWVANPAFPGAVLRNILSPEEIAGIGKKMAVAFRGGPRVQTGGIPKAARYLGSEVDGSQARIAWLLGAEFGEQEQGGGQGQGGGMGMGDAGEPKPEPSAIDKAVDEFVGELREKALTKLRSEMNKDDIPPAGNENQNNNIVKEALKHPSWRGIAKTILGMTRGDLGVARKLFLGMVLYKSGGWGAVRAARTFTGREVLAVARVLDLTSNRRTRIAGENRLYRTVLRVGGTNNYQNDQAFLAACRRVVGRDLTPPEKEALIARGRLYALGS